MSLRAKPPEQDLVETRLDSRPRFSDFEATAAHDQGRAAADLGAGNRPLLISLR
jgi:hypothetical protein